MSNSKEKLRVFSCEDDARTRKLLAKIINSSPDMTLAGEAPAAEEVLAAFKEGVQMDVLLLDLELPGMQGLELLHHVPPPPGGPEILILTSFNDEDRVFQAMKSGAAGYLVKGVETARLLDAVREIAAGGTVIEPRLARRFWNFFQANKGYVPKDPFNLDEKELQALQLLAKGLTNPEMGGVLNTGRRNIKLILESLYAKMSVGSRVEAVVKGFKAGLLNN